MKLHVILASDQVLQNLIPVLMERPQRVCLVVTTALARRGPDQRLRRLLRQVDAELIRCTDAPDAGFADIRAYAHQVVEQVITAGADAEIVLNATGGTKLMAIAYVEVFRGIAQRILYTDTAHQRIEYLPSERDAAVPTPTPMTNVLDVPGYLRAQGFHCQRPRSDEADWQQRVARRKGACKFLGKHIGDAHLQQFVGALNGLADKALERLPNSYDERLAAPVQSTTQPPWGRWAEALGALTQAGILDWTPGSEYLRFRDADAAQFARGLFGSTWLLSARQPTDTLIARARHARIRLIGPDQLQDLRGLVREWRV
jgi:hypothetical protein